MNQECGTGKSSTWKQRNVPQFKKAQAESNRINLQKRMYYNKEENH